MAVGFKELVCGRADGWRSPHPARAHPSPGRLDGRALQMRVEPADDPLDTVAHMVWPLDPMPLVLVDHELRLYAECLQRVPELVALRERDLGVALSVQHERRRPHVADEGDGAGARVDLRVFVDALAEVRQHPLVDAILPVVALPVGDAGACNGSGESVRTGDGPHRHVTAVAV